MKYGQRLKLYLSLASEPQPLEFSPAISQTRRFPDETPGSAIGAMHLGLMLNVRPSLQSSSPCSIG